jgi:hypothetical protein
VFIYDIADEKSLYNVKEQISKFQDHGFTNPIVLFGNKIDNKSDGKFEEQNLEKDYPQAFVGELSAKTHMQAIAPFFRLLKNEASMRQVNAYSPELEGARIPRSDATRKQRTRAGCTSIPWLWLSQYLFRKKKPLVDQIGSHGPTPFTVEGTKPHRETNDPQPSTRSSLLLPPRPSTPETISSITRSRSSSTTSEVPRSSYLRSEIR